MLIVLITRDMTFHQNRSVRSRDTMLTFQFKPEIDFFKPGVNIQTHRKYTLLKLDSYVDYKNMFCFQIGESLIDFAKKKSKANFANLGPPF